MAEQEHKLYQPAAANEDGVRALLARAQSGDQEARAQLVQANQRLVRSIIGRFSGAGRDPEDLFQLGCIGLLKAVDRFDLSYPVRFSTYAVPLILGEVRRHLRDDGLLRVSRALKGLGLAVTRTQEQLTRELGREPSLCEVAGALKVPLEEVVEALDSIRPLVSLQEPVFQGDGDPIYLSDQVADESERESAWLDRVALRQALAQLSDRDRQVLLLRYFRDKTQVEVARLLGVSQVQISRIERRALAQVRELLTGT